jgi:hypothetical protein
VEDVPDGVVAVVPTAIFDDAAGDDEKVETLEKIDADEVGELENVEMFDEVGLLAESSTVDLASAVVPPIPNIKAVAGFASAYSDLTDAAIEESTEVLEPKLNAGDEGYDEETAGLLLATAKMEVDGAEVTMLSADASFGDDEYEKPLLRPDDDDGLEAKWSGAFRVVDAADSSTLSDD